MTRGPESCVRLSVVLAGDEPPSEFRIFTAGKVETTKGTFVFDAKSAESVMASYREHGIDLMVDYDHASLGSMADPALSGRAAGWFQPEVRAGELWAVNVRWTPPAAVALKNKEWLFMSPAFELGDDDRISRLLNVALTNLPATRGLQPLMAASAVGRTTIIMAGESGLSPKLVGQALEAVASKDAKSALDLMKQILAALLGGESEEAAPPDSPDAGPMDPAAASAALSSAALRVGTLIAVARQAMTLTGAKDAVFAMSELQRTFKLAKDLEKRETQLKADRDAHDAAEYVSLAAALVKAEQLSPAFAWADSDAKTPSIMIKAIPLPELRDRVQKLGPAPKTPAPPKPASAGTGLMSLSETEIAMCKQMKCEPAEYLALKLRRDAATTKAGV